VAAYYNEIDRFAAQWLRELIKAGLIADGEVDERDIRDVRADDLRGFTQAHFFAGIGGWSYALRLAGWPDDRPIWTGSCPCQVVSSAARGRNTAADLWPAWFPLIATARPRAFFGEQVAQHGAWLDRVCDDVEPLGYAVGAAVLPACSVGFDHARPRIYFAGHADCDGQPGRTVDAQASRVPRDRSDAGAVVCADGVSAGVAALRGFGNAIVPQVAQAFIEAYCEATMIGSGIQATPEHSAATRRSAAQE
jgi:DNA (cytosine-5)-methyltransferase 1